VDSSQSSTHIAHNKDNQHLQRSQDHCFASRAAILSNACFNWLHSTGAHDTSCPFSFYFFSALISAPGTFCFDGARAESFAPALAGHLAAMYRQYNDYGSVDRDRDQAGNLNSLDIMEFK
jgi:hypothetical protein